MGEGLPEWSRGIFFVAETGVGAQSGRKALTLQTVPPRLDLRGLEEPAASANGFSLSSQGSIRYALKTPYRDGTPHVIFEPLDFIARLTAPAAGTALARGSPGSSGELFDGPRSGFRAWSAAAARR